MGAMTIFGVPFGNVDLEVLRRFLADAEPEPLLWEAKGVEAKAAEVRRQVCGFANSHEGGYLIIGASQGADGQWLLDGVEFPDEPPAWVANVVGNGGVNPYPDGLDTKPLPTADGKHVAVVLVPSIPTPPCNAHGTVYERVSGRTISVREPLRLAQLFARGDQARRDAQAKADTAARQMLVAGKELRRFGRTHVQFGLGLAAAGYLSDISSRLFSPAFEERVGACLEALDHGPLFGGRPRPVPSVSQDSREWVSEGTDNLLGQSWLVRATWHGGIGIYWTQAIDAARIQSVAEGPVSQAWTAAEDLLIALGAQGARYLQLAVAGGSFRANPEVVLRDGRPQEVPPTVVGRGPLAPGVERTVLDSIERELRRATGEMAYEGETPG
jgi:hypothetical protein